MAVTDALATAAQYRAVVGKTDVGADADVLTDLTAVSRMLERELGRFFTKDAAPVTRTYYVPGAGGSVAFGWAESENPFVNSPLRRQIDVDDLAAAPTTLVVDEDGDGEVSDDAAWTISTDYVLLPTNADKGSEPRPWTTIAVPTWSSKGGFWAGARVDVTAVWGWPAVPAAVSRAVCQLTGILRLESPRATSRVSELGDVISTSTEARTIVDRLARQYAGRVVI